MKELQSEDVKDLWAFMADKYDIKIVQKADAWEMRQTGKLLQLMGILDAKDFMERFTTTFAPLKKIYPNFVPGIAKGRRDLLSQVRTCAHEFLHVLHYIRGGMQSQIDYLINSARRAAFEAECYRTNMEIHFWYTGDLLDPHHMADNLSAYGCNKKDIAFAAKHLKLASRVVAQGGISKRTSKETIAFLKSRGYE